MDLKNFYIRRYLRLTPAYYFILTLYCLLNGLNSEYIWAIYLCVNNFIDYGITNKVGWIWSLAIEELRKYVGLLRQANALIADMR